MNSFQFRILLIMRYSMIVSAILLHTSTLLAQYNTARFISLGRPFGLTHSYATDVSANGLVVVGWAASQGGLALPFRWTEKSGFEALPSYPNATSYNVTGVSGDGSIIVGSANISNDPGSNSKALRWSGGTVSALPSPPITPPVQESCAAYAVSYDGTIIVGKGTNNLNQSEALMWIDGKLQNLGYLPGGGWKPGSRHLPRWFGDSGL